MKERKNFRMMMTLLIAVMICIIALPFPTTVNAEAPNGMLAYWKFDEDSETTAIDSANSHTGTLIGDPIRTNGKVGNALDFDGVDDYVTIPREPALEGMESFTYEAWIYKKGSGCGDGCKYYNNEGVIISKSIRGGCGTEKNLMINSDSYVRFTFAYQYDAQALLLDTTTQIQNNIWYHVAGIYDSINDYMYIYINGQQVASKPESRNPYEYSCSPDGNDIHIGAWIFDSYWPGHPYYSLYRCHFNGIIDEVAFYDRALSASELLSHYYAGLAGFSYYETPEGAAESLVEDIEDMDLPVGLETGLITKLNNAINALDNGQPTAAINQLNAFIMQVEAQRGKKLTMVEADALVAAAQWIIDAAGGASMIKNKAIGTSFFLQRLFQRFTLFEKILNQIQKGTFNV
jgi:hypothetical protein